MPRDKVAGGRFLKPFGIAGELKFEAYLADDYPPDAFTVGYLAAAGAKPEREIYIAGARHLRGITWAVQPDGCGSPEEAAEYVNREFLIRRDLLPPLEEGEYLHQDIIGCAVYNESGERLGEISGIMETGANDVWIITAAGRRELLIPATQEVVRQIDVPGRKITIHVLEGLFD
ncbi:MAG: 16S rRNA processing protein RimM [Candidatus Nitrosotenuis sp.]|nr:MAG: 16S rRNA processing protein RimM [Candidatus Nitrosotenuis sp.]